MSEENFSWDDNDIEIISPSLLQAAGAELQVAAVDDIWQLVTSRRPEHTPLRSDLVGLMRTAQTLTEDLDAAMHPEVAGDNFWASFAGEFAAFSIGPLLATSRAIETAVEQRSVAHARIIENPRDIAWWSGKSYFAPVVREILNRHGIRCTQSPGSMLRAVRNVLFAQAAYFQGKRELKKETRTLATGAAHAATIAPCDVLFVGMGATSAPIVGAVWPQLVSEYGLSCVALDFHYQDFATPLSRHNIPRHDIGQFIRSDDVMAVQRMAGKWPQWLRYFKQHAMGVNSFARLSAAMRNAIVDRVEMSFARHAPIWILRRIAGERALEAFQPKTIAQFQIYPINAVPMVRRAIQHGIDVVMLQHGVIGDWIFTSPTLELSEVVVWGSHSEKIHRAVLGEDAVITQTGNSLYDSMAHHNVQPSDKVHALTGNHRAMFVLATQFNEHDFYRDFQNWWLRYVAEACVALDAALVLKLHPADTNLALYQQLVDVYPGTVTIAEHGTYSLPELIVASDGMITRDSTVVFEAGLLGTPAITINLTDRDDWFPYAELGGAVGVYKSGEILSALQRVIEDDDFRAQLGQRRERFLDAQIGPTDGRATARIAERIASHGH